MFLTTLSFNLCSMIYSTSGNQLPSDPWLFCIFITNMFNVLIDNTQGPFITLGMNGSTLVHCIVRYSTQAVCFGCLPHILTNVCYLDIPRLQEIFILCTLFIVYSRMVLLQSLLICMMLSNLYFSFVVIAV